MRRISILTASLLALAAAAAFAAGPATVRPERMKDAAEIRLALERFGVVGSALYVAAHPDDENTAMIAWLSNGKLVRTAYLAATRGDGGQNLIGSEKGEGLGVIRTHELLEARKIDGGEQFFSRAIDFGYSKTPEETLGFWGEDKILFDFVRVMRSFQPDIVITRFPIDGSGTHGHHTASGILAEKAFAMAGDPTAYPELARLLGTWQPKRLFWNAWRVEDTTGLLQVDLGAFNPLLGRSYTELAGESRSMHKSQGFGAAERRGTLINYLRLRAGEPASADPFEGIDLTWRRVPGGEAVIPHLEKAKAAFRAENPAAIIPHLIEIRRILTRDFARDTPWARDTVDRKIVELDELIRQASSLWIEAIADAPSGVPGAGVAAKVTVVNRSSVPIVINTALPATEASSGGPLRTNEPWSAAVTIPIPRNAELSHPHWLRENPEKGAYTVHPRFTVWAVAPDPVAVPLIATVGEEMIPFLVPVMFRWTDPVQGERYRPFELHPPVTANLSAAVIVFPRAEPKRVRVALRSEIDGAKGKVRAVVPPGWTVSPAAADFALAKRDEEQFFSFRVTPPAGLAEGELRVVIEMEGWEPYSLSHVTIDYPHIPVQTLLPNAHAKLVRADIATDGKRLGYVMGAGDEVPEMLRQIGYDVELLSDEDLESGDLSRYDAIVLGVRAYNTRGRLAHIHQRLFEWVRQGGTLVAQYNTMERDLPAQLGPLPFRLSRDRVTVEESPVSILAPGHPLLTTPNAITAADFQGWIQERGLYFPDQWDPAYEPLLAMSDPGETEKRGALLFLRHGEGAYVYAPLAFFRQLPAGVPGAYRLFANLVARRDGGAHGSK
ncbi:MAG TPA: PIG-L family deacetylase [Thermoanaerobaculia bacterium]|nr:PIG-L family deacetylase [Thermoanaerobaculia bacterium]